MPRKHSRAKTDLEKLVALVRRAGDDFTVRRRLATTTLEIFDGPVLSLKFRSVDEQLVAAGRREEGVTPL